MENEQNSVRSILKIFREELKKDYDDKEINQFLYILFKEWKGWNRAQVQLNLEETIQEEEVERFHLSLEELKRHKPIQYIIGRTYFHGMELYVTPDVLIPRPETEELVDLIIRENKLKKQKKFTLLDIGTGSGCIAIGLKTYFPYSSVFALDNSERALQVARKNADINGCHLRFLHQDILQDADQFVYSGFDIIISNPPYIMENERKEMHKNVLEYEPKNALFVPDNDPLIYYRAISVFTIRHLARPGLLYLEINERFGDETRTLLLNGGFGKVEVIKDINDKDRFIRAELDSPVIHSGSHH
jgi:release factor glutamine methyltransferase